MSKTIHHYGGVGSLCGAKDVLTLTHEDFATTGPFHSMALIRKDDESVEMVQHARIDRCVECIFLCKSFDG